MRRAFTLIELIFVIVIIGVLAGMGASSFKTHYLINDTNFIVGKIREAQYRGIGYEHNGFGMEDSSADYERGCISLKDENLTDDNYKLHVRDENDNKIDYGVLCFDSKGRPHDDDFTHSSLITVQKVLTLRYRGKNSTITIEPVSGYAIIKHN
jgi:prepilin-type N-terminal cleavage/methylation domain-containing protein